MINRSSTARQSLVNRSSTARRVPRFGLHRISFCHAFNEASKTADYGSLEVENKNLVPWDRSAPPPSRPAPPRHASPCPAARRPAPPRVALPCPARGMSGFWIRRTGLNNAAYLLCKLIPEPEHPTGEARWTMHGGAKRLGGARRGRGWAGQRRGGGGAGRCAQGMISRLRAPGHRKQPSCTYPRKHKQRKPHVNRITEHEERLTTGLAAERRPICVPSC